jgi:hypothetical protein
MFSRPDYYCAVNLKGKTNLNLAINAYCVNFENGQEKKYVLKVAKK